MCKSLADRLEMRLVTWHSRFFTTTPGKTPADMRELIFKKLESFMCRKSKLSTNQLVFSGKAGEAKDDTVQQPPLLPYLNYPPLI